MRQYLPWVRAGVGTLVTGAWGPPRATVPIQATVTGRVSGSAVRTLTATVLGPGDVTGLDPRQVIRTEPVDGASNSEPSLLACVEFDEPALPWLFTPAAPDEDRLRPWLVLVVVPVAAVELDQDAGAPRPLLRIAASAGEQLPDLDQSWAWAHVQVTGDGDPFAILADPARANATLSRLICPRRLEAGTAYLAALVPATQQGVEAGLARAVSDRPLAPAWTAATGFLELPVYHHWSFATGPQGDFETLVGRLRPVNIPAEVLRGRPLALHDARARTQTPPGPDTLLPGALGGDPDGPPTLDAPLTAALAGLLDLAEPSPAEAAAAGLALPLPSYGRWHAGARAVPTAADSGWFAQLNVHPAARAAAGVGAQVVRELQEELMTAAWQQAGPVQTANQLLRQAQLARAAGRAMLTRFAAMSATGCVSATAAVHGRLLDRGAGASVLAIVQSTRVPERLLGPYLRRVLRPRGPLGRRSQIRPGTLVGAANNTGVPYPGLPPRRPPGTVAVDDVATDPNGARVPPYCTLTPARLQRLQLPNDQWRATANAIAAHQAHIAGCERLTPPPPPVLPLDSIRDVVLAGLDPELTVPARVDARVRRPLQSGDALDSVLAAPDLATPIYRSLLRIDPQLLLPAPDALPLNGVGAVGTNPWFIAAVMAGANTEFGCELLWRGYPTDQRATWLRHFWDRTGNQPSPVPVPEHDIDPLTDWAPEDALGAGAGAGTAHTVILVRGELLSRYPRTTIYLARAHRGPAGIDLQPIDALRPGEAGSPERYPVFSGDLPPDITFLGFDITVQEAVGSGTEADPGWYVVFQEPPTEARFGLDERREATAPFMGWQDLAWSDVDIARHHVQLTSSGPEPVERGGLHLDLTGTSAQIAAALQQRPVRAAVHLSSLVEVR